MEGTAGQVQRHFNLKCMSMNNYIGRGGKIKGKYKVVIEKTIIIEKKTKEEIVSNEHKKTLDYLIRHLQEYGNTVLSSKPDKYLNDLKKSGYKCVVRKVRDYESRESYYILEAK